VKDLNSCTLSIEILSSVILEPAIGSQKDSLLTLKIFAEDTHDNSTLVQDLLKGVSEPVLHVPSYNQKTRNSVYRIYQVFALSDVFLKKVAHPVHFISAILAAVEEESDPRSLVITFDLLRFL